ncbi:type 1 glutamine amidotransferase domain-containing protein [Thalassotalea euphylliae]|uniref:Type 1 glutamine amidotransferase domain-containing protein n=1 Tax=Thalassotalea euphylliae TaxID=1655234 RepID=A0A3E0U536_9GAMM|nr:type 1 glutamine amidotransferase domain-containing protein [Thalassotalea euphylliae]REL32111.1 type 1 glutamine amidotransferase domain-containing protein [Thalassotalea euphylliae]
MKKVLIPLTNHTTLGETDQVNGTYAPELTHVVDVLDAAGIAYQLASIKGGAVPVYGTDIEEDSINTKVLSHPAFQAQLADTTPVSEVNIDEFDAVFYPGGFGLLSDLAENHEFGALAAKHYEQGGIIAAVCHGPACLLPIELSSGDKLLSTVAVTGFTREEEIDYNTIDDIPFLLEESLARNAAQYRKVQPWGEFIVEDKRVITGQNPASAHAVGNALVNNLKG